jgi:hypothetical protein
LQWEKINNGTMGWLFKNNKKKQTGGQNIEEAEFGLREDVQATYTKNLGQKHPEEAVARASGILANDLKTY